MRKIPWFNSTVLVLAILLTSCKSAAPQNQLEKIAKDWSMTIRAAQVMPKYPLQGDIAPGDAWVTSKSMDAEIKSWTEKGFLPLTNTDFTIPMILPSPEGAAFPSYSFTTDKRGSGGIAIPLASYPVLLSFSGAQRSVGSVSLKGATSRGLKNREANLLIQSWARAEINNNYLKGIASSSQPTLLRVITRTFSVTGATVSMTFGDYSGASAQIGALTASPELISATSDQLSAQIASLTKKAQLKTGASIGATPAAPAVSLPASNDPSVLDIQADIAHLERLKTELELRTIKRQISNAEMESKSGGYVQEGWGGNVVSFSERGVTMDEKFPQPLVVGYWALEFLILKNGSLIPLGQVQDLIDDPQRYEAVKLRANEMSRASVKDGKVDDPRGEVNPFD